MKKVYVLKRISKLKKTRIFKTILRKNRVKEIAKPESKTLQCHRNSHRAFKNRLLEQIREIIVISLSHMRQDDTIVNRERMIILINDAQLTDTHI